MKWSPISATRSPTADEMRRWGYLAKARVYQMEMERRYDNTNFPNMAAANSVPSTQRTERER